MQYAVFHTDSKINFNLHYAPLPIFLLLKGNVWQSFIKQLKIILSCDQHFTTVLLELKVLLSHTFHIYTLLLIYILGTFSIHSLGEKSLWPEKCFGRIDGSFTCCCVWEHLSTLKMYASSVEGSELQYVLQNHQVRLGVRHYSTWDNKPLEYNSNVDMDKK